MNKGIPLPQFSKNPTKQLCLSGKHVFPSSDETVSTESIKKSLTEEIVAVF